MGHYTKKVATSLAPEKDAAVRKPVETRCAHGFLRSAVPCPVCDGVAAKNRPGKRASGEQYNFEDLVGKPVAGAKVVARAPNAADGSAAWLIKLICGHTRIVRGAHLRSIEKEGRTLRCGFCPIKTRGAVKPHG